MSVLVQLSIWHCKQYLEPDKFKAAGAPVLTATHTHTYTPEIPVVHSMYLPIEIGRRRVAALLCAAPFGLLQRRTWPSAAFAMPDDLAISMHLTDAARFAAGRPL